MSQPIITADHHEVQVGGLAYDYYGDKLDDSAVVRLVSVDIPGGSPEAPWAEWEYVNPTPAGEARGNRGRCVRDGARVCSLGNAYRQGWLSAEGLEEMSR